MGNNAAFTAFESTVIAVYNHGVLTKELLSDLMEPYREIDIDHGGMEGTLSKDGLDVEEIVIQTFGKPLPVRPVVQDDLSKLTSYQESYQETQMDAYWNYRTELFRSITDQFGWG